MEKQQQGKQYVKPGEILDVGTPDMARTLEDLDAYRKGIGAEDFAVRWDALNDKWRFDAALPSGEVSETAGTPRQLARRIHEAIPVASLFPPGSEQAVAPG